jgi:hypothetical protein
VNDTPSSARTVPSRVLNSTDRPSTDSSGSAAEVFTSVAAGR